MAKKKRAPATKRGKGTHTADRDFVQVEACIARVRVYKLRGYMIITYIGGTKQWFSI